MNPAAFDALIDRLDAEIAEGPVPLRKIAASITIGREDIGPWQPRIEDVIRAEREASNLGLPLPCPPRPPEPPPATPRRSWLSRLLLLRRTR